MQAVILAGGLGTRLRPLTYEIPKSMVLIHGKPYLEYQLAYLRQQGILDIVMLIGYLGEQIIDYFGNGDHYGVRIEYSREITPLGTGGGLKKAEKLLNTDFLLLYGDSFLPVDYSDVFAKHKRCRANATICLYDNRDNTDVMNNTAIDDETQKVIKYCKDKDDKTLKYVDAGVMVLNKSILCLIPSEKVVSLEKEIFPMLIMEESLYAYVSLKRFYDIGTSERLALAAEIFR